jgi:two-component system NtrC family response regulator
MSSKLLIVDDDEDIRTQMKWALTNDYEVVLAEDRPGALASAKDNQPPVVLLDLGLPPHPNDPTEGLATLSELLSQDSSTKVIIISGQAERANALQAIGQGAYDFLCKPVEVEELKYALKRAMHVHDLETEYREMQQNLKGNVFEGMLGSSPQMQEVFTKIRKVAPSDASVLILGESGTGKEMVAQAIHRQSSRKDGPFVGINCGAIPDTLLESELFGHEKGAFTGAHAQKPGRIERAEGGTLFLDEIGELTPALQVKLLRFLQEQRFERVGGRKEIEIDVRVIAATNADLTQEMTTGEFREDLFYRLAVVVIKLPPMRERRGDVSLLANAFLQKFGAASGKKNLRFNDQTLRLIEQYHWPGNVRELENRVKRGVIMAEGSRVAPADMELAVGNGAAVRTLKEARETLELEMVQEALRRHNGKISAASTELGISRPTFYELMEKLGLKPKPGDEIKEEQS